MRKISYSFVAVLIGWAAGFIYYVVASSLLTSWGRPTDVEAIVFWTAIFISIGWVVFVIPFVFLVPESSFPFDLRVAPLMGAISGLTVFFLLVGWWTGFMSEGLYIGYALVVGAATACSYALLLKIRGSTASSRE